MFVVGNVDIKTQIVNDVSKITEFIRCCGIVIPVAKFIIGFVFEKIICDQAAGIDKVCFQIMVVGNFV